MLSSQDLLRVRRKHYVGDEMTLRIWRDGYQMDVVLILSEAKTPAL